MIIGCYILLMVFSVSSKKLAISTNGAVSLDIWSLIAMRELCPCHSIQAGFEGSCSH